jgi:trehalose-6-phosphatase
MKTYEFTFDYNLNINIEVKAKNKNKASDIAYNLILDKIDEMLKVGNDNEHEIDFQEGSLENWGDD